MNKSQPVPGSLAAAVVAICATYVYFLVYAEFALLGLAEPMEAAGLPLRVTMGALGVGGVLGSIVAAWAHKHLALRPALAGGFTACAVTAVVSLFAASPAAFLVTAGTVGLSLGWLTVTLVTGLRSLLGGTKIGWWCGLGTGSAYALCNLPALFTASPRVQAVAGATAAGLGLVSVFWIQPVTTTTPIDADTSRRTSWLWLIVLLTLVWFDSAAFYVIQHTAALKGATWSGDSLLIGNALTHFFAALLAGAALDRGWAGKALGLATLLLAVACLLLSRDNPPPVARLLYTAGVSIYSTALVFYPARAGRPWLSALLYAVAGWLGSALGIGMAQDLQGVPRAFVVVATVVVLTALVVRWRWLQHTVTGLALAVVFLGAATPETYSAEPASDPLVAAGRNVYISEGCIHCHSQYVRPRVEAEVIRWGPVHKFPDDVAGTPPLLGNRRQGPDLSSIGNRRSAEWQRLHLIEPRAIVPGSRMPAYDHLFSGTGERGEALVAYLVSLGGETLSERLAQNARWTPAPDALAHPDVHRGGALFAQLCAPCHGPFGHADGPLTQKLMLRPPDFGHDAWRRLDPADPAPLVAVARIVKFGVPGATMAGHEYLSDNDTVGLAAFVLSLHKDTSHTP
jgi:cytochrome c oxidase cbb3-type subunit 2